jgi:hypothetical protein
MNLRQLFRRLRPGLWSGWPDKAYQREGYQQRLQAVQEHLAECLDDAPAGPVRILSMCAGDGRDVIGAVRAHRRRKDVAAWLVELNSQSVELGKGYSVNAGLERSLKFINADATVYETYKSIGAADIVLVCGVWGHVPANEKTLLVKAVSTLCKPGGAVIWTRGTSKGIARVREIEALFAGSWWNKGRVTYTPDATWAIATYRYRGPAHELPGDGQIFHFQKNAG